MQSTPHAGTVLRVEPPVVDVRFTPDGAPDVFDALAAADADPSLRVVQTLGDGVVRCILHHDEPPTVGQRFANRTADGGTYMSIVATEELLGTVVQALGEPRIGMRETGIKPIDLFCPLPESGNVALLGAPGTGKMVVAVELIQRLGDAGPQLFCLSDRQEPALIRDLREAAEEFDRRVLWIVATVANDPDFARQTEMFDAVVYTSPFLGIRGLWPAVDPLFARSTVEVGERHARVSARARALLRDARDRTFDPVLLEYLALRATGAARRRLEASVDPGDGIVRRARRLEAFLTNPFDVAKEMTGRDGEIVPLEATLDGVEAILAGDCDHLAPDDLRFVGALPA
jgi:F-type H+-transporting ATPase subunit beta